MKKLLALTALLLLMTTGCGNNVTGTADTDVEPPYNPVDEGWKVLENYIYSWNHRDHNLMDTTLDSNFFHLLLEADWADYDGDGVIDTGWERDLELYNNQVLFGNCEVIEFTLAGDREYIWPDDPTGESTAYPRLATTKVWYTFPDSGYVEYRNIILVCRPDSTGNWFITNLIEVENAIF